MSFLPLDFFTKGTSLAFRSGIPKDFLNKAYVHAGMEGLNCYKLVWTGLRMVLLETNPAWIWECWKRRPTWHWWIWGWWRPPSIMGIPISLQTLFSLSPDRYSTKFAVENCRWRHFNTSIKLKWLRRAHYSTLDSLEKIHFFLWPSFSSRCPSNPREL